MDPDACLAEIRADLVAMDAGLDEWDEAAIGVHLAEKVKALDEWLGNGGYLPAAWTDRRKPRLRSRL